MRVRREQAAWCAPILACALAALFLGCDRSATASNALGQAERSAQEPAATAVPSPTGSPPAAPRFVTASSDGAIARVLLLDSHLMVERDVGVASRRDGIIDAILADRGQRVTEGQPLARLEDGDLVLSEKAAELDLEKEQSSYERGQKLYEQAIIPKEEFEQVRLRRDAAQKALERIRYELSKCVIKAPFDGVISGRYVEKGQVIKEDDSRVLFQVTALAPLLARVYVPEWALVALRAGQKARVIPAVRMEAAQESDGGVEARVKWINDVLDAASATGEVLVEIVAGPAGSGMKPGMSVQVRLDLVYGNGRTNPPVLSLPREALPAGDPAPGQILELRVLSPDGGVRPRSVLLGFIGDQRVEVRRGLSAGEKVVIE